LEVPSKIGRPYLERAVQIDPYNAVSYYHLATLYRQLGRTGDSRRELTAFQKVKEAKERLKDVYKEMRLHPAITALCGDRLRG
jgi:hypothetical protein